MLQFPAAFTGVLPSKLVPSNICIVLFASPFPLKVRLVAVVRPSPVGVVSGENDETVGRVGAAVSTVTTNADDGALVLPAELVSVDVKECFPSCKALVI